MISYKIYLRYPNGVSLSSFATDKIIEKCAAQTGRKIIFRFWSTIYDHVEDEVV